MDVGDEHRLDLVEPGADVLEAGAEHVPRLLGVPAGVDEGDATVALQRVDEHVAQRVVGQGHRDRPQSRPHLLDRGHDVLAPGLELRGAGDLDHTGKTPWCRETAVRRREA